MSSIGSQDSGLATRRPGYVEIDCSAPGELREWAREDVYKAVDLLEAAHLQAEVGAIPRSSVKDLEMVTGLNRNPTGLLSPSPLRPHRRAHIQAITCMASAVRRSISVDRLGRWTTGRASTRWASSRTIGCTRCSKAEYSWSSASACYVLLRPTTSRVKRYKVFSETVLGSCRDSADKSNPNCIECSMQGVCLWTGPTG